MSLSVRLRAFGISKALDYLGQGPGANLPKLMDWLDKYTGERLVLPYQELFRRTISDPGNDWHRPVEGMYTDTDSRVLREILENFVIYAGLVDWSNRNAAGGLGNGHALWAAIIDPSLPCEMGCRGYGASIYNVRPYMEFDSPNEEIEARKERGHHLSISSGGNPLTREQETIALCNRHTDCVLTAFTPPRFITGELYADPLRVRNLFPAIQVDEDGVDATRATALLRRCKLPFDVACRYIAENTERVATELYYGRVIATGAEFCRSFTCSAYGPGQPTSLEQLEAIHWHVQEFRRSKPLLIPDLWDRPSPSVAAPRGGTA